LLDTFFQPAGAVLEGVTLVVLLGAVMVDGSEDAGKVVDAVVLVDLAISQPMREATSRNSRRWLAVV
jgi:hypothetical protein